jgi:hypothetical protein
MPVQDLTSGPRDLVITHQLYSPTAMGGAGGGQKRARDLDKLDQRITRPCPPSAPDRRRLDGGTLYGGWPEFRSSRRNKESLPGVHWYPGRLSCIIAAGALVRGYSRLCAGVVAMSRPIRWSSPIQWNRAARPGS